MAGASSFDVCQVGRNIETTFEPAASYIFRNSVSSSFNSTRTVYAAIQVNMFGVSETVLFLLAN